MNKNINDKSRVRRQRLERTIGSLIAFLEGWERVSTTGIDEPHSRSVRERVDECCYRDENFDEVRALLVGALSYLVEGRLELAVPSLIEARDIMVPGPARAVVARAIDLAAGRCPLALYYTALAAAAVAMCAAAEEQ